MAYHIARDNQQIGVFEETEVRSKLASGEFRSSDLAWTEGMAEWKPLGVVLPPEPPPVLEATSYAPPAIPAYVSSEQSGTAPLATLGQRLGAALVDSVPGFILFIAATVVALGKVAAYVAADPSGAEDSEKIAQMAKEVYDSVFYGWGVIVTAPVLILNLIWLATRGQTIGKRIVGIRIAGMENDNNPGWVKTIAVRWVGNYFITIGLVFILPIVGLLYAITDIFFIFGSERRCIHDLLAGTRVVRGHPQPPL